jgi:hypothetical protein
MGKNRLERIKAQRKESMECGYSPVYRSNWNQLLGEPTDSQEVDNLLLSILNRDGQEGSHVIPKSPMTYFETSRGEVKPLLSGLANVALVGSYGVENICYVDMKKGTSSEKSSQCLSSRIESHYEAEPSSWGSPFSLVLVNAGVSLKSKQVERANSLIESLTNLPSSVFRIGLIASPKFIEAVNLGNYLKGTPEQPKADVAHRPALAG